MNGRTLYVACVYSSLLVLAHITKPVEGFLYIDLFENDFLLFPQLRCLLALRSTGFDIGDFTNYPKAFRDDSIMELAQSGTFQGAAGIEEYVKFAYAGTSPFVACCNEYIKRDIKFLGYENGQCKFMNVLARNFEFIPNTTAATLEASSKYQIVAALKLYLNFKDPYIKRINVFYTDDLLRVFFSEFMNSTDTRQYVCGVINGICASTLNISANANTLTCEKQLLTLPTVEGKGYIDGKSQGCRALHSVFASTNPIDHCAHLSYTPLKDPKGNIKCQTSKGTLPSSLFTDSEMKIFKDFATSVGVDPELGLTQVG